MKLTPEQLREIEERAEQATPGPWHIIEDVDTQQLFGGYMAMMQLFKAPKKSEEYAEYWLNENDAAFVEQSRTDIPRLLAHIKALEEEAKNWRIQFNGAEWSRKQELVARDRYESANKALKIVLKEARNFVATHEGNPKLIALIDDVLKTDTKG